MLKYQFVMSLWANIVPEVTRKIERQLIEYENIKAELIKYELTDNLKTAKEMSIIDVLIESDCCSNIVSMKGIENTDTLHLLGLRIESIFTGRTKANNINNKNVVIDKFHWHLYKVWGIFRGQMNQLQNNVQSQIEEFWNYKSLETIEIKKSCKETGGDKALENFNQTVEYKQARYHIQWPWREDNPKIPDNYPLAHERLLSTVKL